MKNRNGIKWSRDETILAFELYCRTPLGKIGQSNPDIVELAELLGRTPGSVGLKMHNLAHFDSTLQQPPDFKIKLPRINCCFFI